MKTIFWSLLLLALTAFKGCETKDCCGPTPANMATIAGKWLLANPKTGYTFTLVIEAKTKEDANAPNEYRLSGISSVNQYGADATFLADGTISVGSIISTKRGGTPEAMDAETAYYSSLQKATKAEMVGGNLQLRSSDPNWSLLVFNKQ